MEYEVEQENGVLGDVETRMLGDIEGRGVEVRVWACKGVNLTSMYHRDYCDGRMSLALMVAMLVLGFVTVFVNLGVIIRTVRILRQGHDKPAFYFIGNLALSDFAVGLYVVIAFLLHVTNKSDLWQQSTCMLQIGVAVTACQETIFTIVLISVDKYLYICHGLHYNTIMTTGRVYGALIVSWCLALLVGALPALGLHVTWKEACNRCAFPQVVSTPFAIVFFVTSVAVPLAVVVGLYSVLLTLALRMQKARYGGSYAGSQSVGNSHFRLSFMSAKKSRSSTTTSKASISTMASSTSSSTSSSKASRRRTRRREMERYKNELVKRDVIDGGNGGGGGGDGGDDGVRGPLKPPEGVKLIQDGEGGVPKGVAPPYPIPEVLDIAKEEKDTREEEKDITNDISTLHNTTSDPVGGDAEGYKDIDTQIDSKDTTSKDIEPEKDLQINGETEQTEQTEQTENENVNRENGETEEDLYDLEEPQIFPSEDEAEGVAEVETQEGRGGGGGWTSFSPSKYMNRVMTDTRDKVLFLKKCRAVKTVLLILISFAATYVPFVVGTLVYSADAHKRPCLLHLLNTLLYCAVVANSLANPLIYAYGYREFRLKSEKFKGILARKKTRPYK